MVSCASKQLTSVDKALQVLLLLSREPRLGVREIGRRLGISAPTVHRLLTTLASHGLTEQAPGGHDYRLGFACLDLGRSVLADVGLVQICPPVALDLRDATRETVTIQVPVGTDQVTVFEAQGLDDIRHTVGVGRRMALHAGASGRAILAYQPLVQLTLFRRSRLTKVGPNTVTDKAALVKLLEHTRRVGYALSRGESREGVAGVAAPVFGQDGTIEGSISISGPESRLVPAVIKEITPKVVEAGRLLSRNLGYDATKRHTEVSVGMQAAQMERSTTLGR
jgi:DNA-binding IclR family transcriptional regulator